MNLAPRLSLAVTESFPQPLIDKNALHMCSVHVQRLDVLLANLVKQDPGRARQNN